MHISVSLLVLQACSAVSLVTPPQQNQEAGVDAYESPEAQRFQPYRGNDKSENEVAEANDQSYEPYGYNDESQQAGVQAVDGQEDENETENVDDEEVEAEPENSDDVETEPAEEESNGEAIEAVDSPYFDDFEGAVDGDYACTVFRSLGWLAYSLIEQTQLIVSESALTVFDEPSEQEGPLVLVLRSMIQWAQLLDDFEQRLRTTPVWSLKTQLQVTKCYADYSYSAAGFLEALEAQATDFTSANPARCLVYDHVESLYFAYLRVAALLYGEDTGYPSNVQMLLTATFPDVPPRLFFTKLGAPKPGETLRGFLRENDAALPETGGLFAENQKAWNCADFKKEVAGDAARPGGDEPTGTNTADVTPSETAPAADDSATPTAEGDSAPSSEAQAAPTEAAATETVTDTATEAAATETVIGTATETVAKIQTETATETATETEVATETETQTDTETQVQVQPTTVAAPATATVTQSAAASTTTAAAPAGTGN